MRHGSAPWPDMAAPTFIPTAAHSDAGSTRHLSPRSSATRTTTNGASLRLRRSPTAAPRVSGGPLAGGPEKGNYATASGPRPVRLDRSTLSNTVGSTLFDISANAFITRSCAHW